MSINEDEIREVNPNVSAITDVYAVTPEGAVGRFYAEAPEIYAQLGDIIWA